MSTESSGDCLILAMAQLYRRPCGVSKLALHSWTNSWLTGGAVILSLNSSVAIQLGWTMVIPTYLSSASER